MTEEKLTIEQQTMIEEMAQRENITKEEARKKYLPIIKSPSEQDKLAKMLEPILANAETVRMVSEKLPPEARGTFAQIAAMAAAQSKEDPYGLKDIEAGAMRIKHAREMAKIYGESGDSATTLADALGKVIDKAMGPVAETLKILQEEISGKRKTETQEVLDKIIETINLLVKGKPEESGEPTAEEMWESAQQYKEKATSFLAKFGYKVDSENLTKEQWEIEKEKFKEIISQELTNNPAKVAEILKKGGYEILGGPMTYKEAMELVAQKVKEVQDQKMDTAQLEAVERMIRSIAHDVTQTVFAPLAQAWASGSMGGGEQPSKEQSQGSEDSGQPS